MRISVGNVASGSWDEGITARATVPERADPSPALIAAPHTAIYFQSQLSEKGAAVFLRTEPGASAESSGARILFNALI